MTYSNANFTPSLKGYSNVKPFRFWCQKVLPLVYDDSLSYYELLCKVVDYLNHVIDDLSATEDNVGDLFIAYNQLQDYVNIYFTNLDVQEEINNKLDNLVEDGTLEELVGNYIQPRIDEINKELDNYEEEMTANFNGLMNATESNLQQQNDKIFVLEGRMDTFTNLPTGSTTGDAELQDVRVAFNGAIYPTAGDAVRAQASQLNVEVEKIESSLEEVTSLNKYDPQKSVIGGLWLDSGEVITSTTNLTTSDFIKISPNDKVYLCGVDSDGEYIYGTGVINGLCWYDKNKTFIGGIGNTNGYTITANNAKYIRFTFVNTGRFGTARIISLTLNWLPALAEVPEWFDPYYVNTYDIATEAKTKAEQALNYISGPVDDKIIDCWGDSRTEMVFRQGTSYADYLQTLLGSQYCVSGHGKSSQASGMCAARLGSNEVFVTVEDGLILSSGNTHITNLKVSSGLVNNYFCYSADAGVPCTLMGVKGKVYKMAYNDYTTCYFVREIDGAVTSCPQNTKMIVEDYNSKHHGCIFWWGKNDMRTAEAGRNAIKTIYADAVKYIRHDRYIILGETCSVSSDYEVGQPLRTFVDNFNSEMAQLYPNNFIDINAWLASQQALTSVGLTPTETDLQYIEKGWPAYSLMEYSTNTNDPVHPNAKGREAIANRIYDWMNTNNWLN